MAARRSRQCCDFKGGAMDALTPALEAPSVEHGSLGACPVAPDALQGIKRQQTNPARWGGESWSAFAGALRSAGVEVSESIAARGAYATDAGGTAYGLPHGVVIARSAEQI